MTMTRQLTKEEIEKFASQPNVKRIAVENVLMSLTNDVMADEINVERDIVLYKWNSATCKAIREAMRLAHYG